MRQFLMAGTPAEIGLRDWFRDAGYWYITSAVVHAIGFVLVAIVLSILPGCPGVISLDGSQGSQALTLESSNVEEEPAGPIRFEVGQAPLDPTELSPDTLLAGPQAPQAAIKIDDSDTFVEPGGGRPSPKSGPLYGGLGGFSIPDLPGPGGFGGVGVSSGTGTNPGVGGGEGNGFGGRGKGSRDALIGVIGGTRPTERAVAGGLYWLARHQDRAGFWSLQHAKYCKGGHSCSGEGSIQANAGATAMALLAFQGAGQTHKTKGPYRQQVHKAIAWFLKHQNQKTGDLSVGAPQPMYSHGLATIALCEAYAMTRDEAVGRAARKAVDFIQAGQNEVHGGWRYVFGSHDGDTSVTGWQVMALKSAQMAGIGVNSMSLEGARRWLASCAQGQHHGLYVYQPYREVSPTMTAVGMLCQQYMGIAANDPGMVEGKQYLLENMPDENLQRDVYYWYYATLVMHNFMGPDWDRWNRQMRRILVKTQCKGGCAEGSWDPERPTLDRWAQGGRVFETALSTLTLEVYYRYLPLFKINQGPVAPPPNTMGLAEGLPAASAPQKPAGRTP